MMINWNSKILQSRVRTEQLGKAEMILGYLIGPSLMFLMVSALSSTYLMQYYTDVIGISGSLIVLMPIISKIAVAIMNVIFSDMINRTNTSQGRARPWLLLSGLLMPAAGIMLYMVPKASYQIQVTWILFSYNFFFVIAYNIYSLAHNMMIPRASRDSKERDKLTLFKNVAEAMIPGSLSAVIMPFIISAIGVGDAARSRWFSFMLILSIMAVPAALIEYRNTLERVEVEKKSVPLLKQFKDSLRYKEWVLIMLLIFLKALDGALQNNSMIYYSNWVWGQSVQAGAKYQALLNVIGQFPLGLGTIAMWPLVRKYGKYRVMQIGFLVSTAGLAFMLMVRGNFPLTLAGLFVKSIGATTSMMSVAMMSDVIEKIEKKEGVRYDSLGASMNAIFMNLTVGLVQSAVLLGIRKLGYIAPSSSTEVIQQPQAVLSFFEAGMVTLPMIGCILCFIITTALIRIEKDEA
ncbi:MAG: MFS transporter [Oscillospiraceae bacterium]|nr:MFS transporter [Oscillospiraceae bacterium]